MDSTCCIESLYLQYMPHILPPVQLFNYQVFILVHKTIFFSALLPSIFQNDFTPNNSMHRYETIHNRLYLTHVNITFAQRILRYKGTQLWNILPINPIIFLITLHPNPFLKKLKLLLICDPMVKSRI